MICKNCRAPLEVVPSTTGGSTHVHADRNPVGSYWCDPDQAGGMNAAPMQDHPTPLSVPFLSDYLAQRP